MPALFPNNCAGPTGQAISWWWSPGAAAPCGLQGNGAEMLLHPLLCQLTGKVIPAARGHPRFLTAATKLQESTADDGISLLLGEGGKTALATTASAPCPSLLGPELTPCHLLLRAMWLLLPWQGRERHEVGLAQPAPLMGFIPHPLGPQLFCSQHSRACAGRKRHFQQGVPPSSLSPRKGSSAEKAGFQAPPLEFALPSSKPAP